MTNIRTVSVMVAACARARADLRSEIKRNPELRDMRWWVDREPCVITLGEDGERLSDGNWTRWDRRRSTVEALLSGHPQAAMLVVEGGVNVAENRGALDAGIYESFIWQVEIWNRNDPTLTDVQELEAIVRRRTAFASFEDMFNAKGDYRPSMDVADPEMLRLANHYDHAAEQRGDARRVYRYGHHREHHPADIEHGSAEERHVAHQGIKR